MSGAEPRHRDWVKLWIKESLLGTIREDLTSAERGIWYDFLLLAGNSRIPGVICANEKTAMPTKRIAGILNVSERLVQDSIQKFLDSGRITIDEQGIIHIVNWGKYQYSDYDRQKQYRQKDEDKPSPASDEAILGPAYHATDWEAEAKRLTKELELVVPFTAEEARGYTADLQREALRVPIDMTGVKQD